MIYLLFFAVVFETVLALIAQALGIFYFWPVFGANLAAILAAGFFLAAKKIRFNNFKIDWFLVFTIFVSFLCLYQVHYNYTGKVNYATDQSVIYHDVKNMAHPYPYFSDEWDAVAMIKYSINSHSLPFKNPLDGGFYLNFAAPFFSFLSGIVLLFRADPLLIYNFLSIFFNCLIIALAYAFLKANKVPAGIAAISALLLLFIPSAANLPGFWHLIPIHFGIIFSLFGFCFLSENKLIMATLSGLLVLAFYPPLIIFYAPSLLVFWLAKIKNYKKIILIFIFGLAGVFVLAGVFYLLRNLPWFSGFYKAISNRVFYPSFSGSYIPQFMFYDVIPWPAIIFFPLGAWFIFKKIRWLLAQIAIGGIFWVLYSFVDFRIIIDYERVVFFSSIIAVLIAGFGMKIAFGRINTKFFIAGAFLFFLFFSPFYSRQEGWKKFVLVNPKTGQKAYAKAPANSYLAKEDLNIFKDINNKKFLSVPWKGLVISAATGNYPAVAKEGIISAGRAQTVAEFVQASCKEKKNMAKTMKLDYVYLSEFDCPGFEKVGQSSEGFILYLVKK